jgi:glycine betaine/choline ABC-type transport system substrate-binding protein
MTIHRVFLSSLCVALVACTAQVANAQTGPIGGSQTLNQSLTAESVASLLEKRGQKTNVITGQHGSKVVRASIEKGKWKYVVEIVFVPTGGGTVMDLCTPLGAARDFSQQHLFTLLEKNMEIGFHQKYYAIAKNGQLVLMNISFPVGRMTEQDFLRILDGHLEAVRGSFDVLQTAPKTISTPRQ